MNFGKIVAGKKQKPTPMLNNSWSKVGQVSETNPPMKNAAIGIATSLRKKLAQRKMG